MNSPAIETMIKARTKATIAGINGSACHIIPAKNGTKIGSVPIIKKEVVVLTASIGTIA